MATDAKQRTREQIAVMQAWLDGEEIESKTRGGVWVHEPSRDWQWNWAQCNYRVKPKEPREFWIAGHVVFADVDSAKSVMDGVEVTHVREVLDD